MKPFDLRPLAVAAMICVPLPRIPQAETLSQENVAFHGGGSFRYGEIWQSSDTSQINYTGNLIQNVSALFSMDARFNDRTTVSTGLGIVERHFLSGRISDNGGRTPFVWSPYVVNASLRYAFWENEATTLAVTAGYFPYRYSSDNMDMGLYLLRGPVYPGVLVSGYDSKYTQPVSNTMGMRLQYVTGPLEQNLILGSEIENYPLFDVSPAYVAEVKIGKAFRVGAGVNFYHRIAIEPKLTSPRAQIYVDTVAHDTTFLSFAGTKVMANAGFDPKVFFPGLGWGPEDLKLYGEIAVIGLDQSKAYKAVYGDLMHRMPVMVGFNFPVFGYLNRLSLEVEWYGSKVKDDLGGLQSTTGNFQSPLPVVNSAGLNLTRDNWKWCLHIAKTLGHLQVNFQAANDHTRPGGTLTSPGSEWETYFVTPRDFYWLAELGFFF